MTQVELEQLRADQERQIAAAAERLQALPDQVQASRLLAVMSECLRYDRQLIEVEDPASWEHVQSLLEVSYSRLSELHSACASSWLPDKTM